MRTRIVTQGRLGFWRRAVRRALRSVGTPCFVFAPEPMSEAVMELESAFAGLPVRHWWSCKTLALPAALGWWRRQGRPVEVVSERELLAALDMGFPPSDILVNGPAKHRWLRGHPVRGLRVNFDSPREATVLAPLARRCGWRLGVRINTRGEVNAEFPGVRSQFGMLGAELGELARTLRRARLVIEVVHFHLRTNVAEASEYVAAGREALRLAEDMGWAPSVLDLGGGFPPRWVADRQGRLLDARFSLEAMRGLVEALLKRGRGLREVWFENGRRLAAPGAVLALGVADLKRGRGGTRTAICDGGRTLHAMVATWERHGLATERAIPGRNVRTLVCGPTCMAFDNLGLHPLPAGLREDDRLLWFDAGAYQLSWETQFSHGRAPVVWVEGTRVEVVREAERLERRASAS